MDSKVTFDNHLLYDKISKVLRDFRSEEGTRKTKEKLNELLKEASDDDYKLIEIVINCFNELPLFAQMDEEIGEAELQGNYVDPLVYPMFHNPQENIYFRWYMNTLHC